MQRAGRRAIVAAGRRQRPTHGVAHKQRFTLDPSDVSIPPFGVRERDDAPLYAFEVDFHRLRRLGFGVLLAFVGVGLFFVAVRLLVFAFVFIG